MEKVNETPDESRNAEIPDAEDTESQFDTDDLMDRKQKENVEIKVKEAATKVARGLSSGAESMSSVVKKALQAREHVIMVRVNEASLQSINQLKDAGLFRSRSEAAAYLIAEGISAKQDLFQRIMKKIEKINLLKEELRALAGADEILRSVKDQDSVITLDKKGNESNPDTGEKS